MKKWKPTPDEKKALKAFAAKSERRPATKMIFEIGERYKLGEYETNQSINVLLLTDDPDWGDTDLAQTTEWSDLDAGVPLTDDGKAVLDFYVYEREFNDHGDLLTNIQAHVDTKHGKPVLWKITGTMATPLVLDAEVAAANTDPVGVDG